MHPLHVLQRIVRKIKKQQIEGVRDPNQDLVTKLQIEEDYISRLAKRFLEDNGIDTAQYEPAGTLPDLPSERPEEQ